jgi:GGDEF domain-containing protein
MAHLTRVLRAALPGVLVAAAALVGLTQLDDAALASVAGRYALIAHGAGLVLGAAFHRSRVVAGILALGYLHIAHLGPVVSERFLGSGTVIVALSGMLALTRDRGVRSRAGLLQLGLGASLVGLAHTLLADPVALAAFADVRLLPAGWSGRAGVPDLTLVAGSLAVAVGLLGAVRWRGPVERALLWTQVLVLAALHPGWSGPQASLLLMAAGLILALSVLEQSYFMAYRDELTGLPARRALMRDLAEAGGTYAVAMIDVDHFKKFNDTHGHDVGDQVLQLVATKLSATRAGKAYRYGGEEFTLLFPGLARDDAVEAAEVVRRAVEEATFSLRGWNRPRKRPSGAKPKKRSRKRPRSLSVTVSMGLADSSAGEGSVEAILKKADQALYRAKEGGRNRVSV